MISSHIIENTDTKISAAITQFYEEADFKPDQMDSNIVPLYQLIDIAYPLPIIEKKKLTYKRVSEIINKKATKPISLPRDDDKSLSGFLYAELVFGCVLVNQNDPIVRRRFSVAHELGHYVLHFLPFIDDPDIDVEREKVVVYEGLGNGEQDNNEEILTGKLVFTRANGQQADADEIVKMEQEANQFAAELLMPTSACHQLVEQFIPRFGKKRAVLGRRLATEFLVSKSAMIRRLKDLSLP